MKITFTIPDVHPFEVVIERNWFTGSFTWRANGKTREIKSPLALRTHFDIDMKHDYNFAIGEHFVEIEHSRPRFFAGLRPQRYVVKVDGELVADRTGF